MTAPPALVVVGRVVRPHGLRGEMRVQPETDFPERLGMLGQAVLVTDERSEPVRIEAVRGGRGAVGGGRPWKGSPGPIRRGRWTPGGGPRWPSPARWPRRCRKAATTSST